MTSALEGGGGSPKFLSSEAAYSGTAKWEGFQNMKNIADVIFEWPQQSMAHRLQGRKGRKLLSLKYGPQKPIPFGVGGRKQGKDSAVTTHDLVCINLLLMNVSQHLEPEGLLAEQCEVHEPQLILPSVQRSVVQGGLSSLKAELH